MIKKMLKKVIAIGFASAIAVTTLPSMEIIPCINSGPISITAASETKVNVKDEAGLRKAIKDCPVGGTVNITLKDHIRISESINIDGRKTININGANGNGRFAIGTKESLYRLFGVQDGSSLHISNTNLKGGYLNNNHTVQNTVLAAEGGTIIFDNSIVQYSCGILLVIRNGGTVTATSTQFLNNSGTLSNTAGAIQINNGSFNMKSGCKVSSQQWGGVHVGSKGTFNMYGGDITGNNKAVGGGVCVVENGIFNMYDGNITCNTAQYGGGVYCNGTFNMHGGNINNNAGTVCGKEIQIDGNGCLNVASNVQGTDLMSNTANLNFNGIPASPFNLILGYTISNGQAIANCADNVPATSCLQSSYFSVSNDNRNPRSIIVQGEFTISLLSNDGTGKVINIPGKSTETINIQNVFTRLGYDLIGWSTEPSGIATVPIGGSIVVQDNAAYYAIWKPRNILIEYRDSDDTLIHNSTYTFENPSISMLDAYTKTGYEFQGWKDISDDASGNTIYRPGQTIVRNDRDCTFKLKATYEEKTITVDFNPNKEGATVPSKTASVKYEDTLSLAENSPSLTGYTFSGWYFNGEKVTEVTPKALKQDSTIILVARWEPISCPISISPETAGNVSKVELPTAVNYNQTFVLPSAETTKAGYKFAGWLLNGDNTKTVLAPGTTVSPESYGVTSIILTPVLQETTNTANTQPQSTPTVYNNAVVMTDALGNQTILEGNDAIIASSGAANQLSNDVLKFSTYKKTLAVGEKFKFVITTNEAYETKLSSNNIVMDGKGNITAVKPGKVIITVTAANVTKTCTVVIKKPATAKTMAVKAKKVKVGKSVSVKPVFKNGTYSSKLTYSVSNKSIASVTSDGRLTGHKTGIVKVTIKAKNGAKKVVKIKVTK